MILVSGLGFSSGLTFTIGGASITLTGLAIAAIAGIVLTSYYNVAKSDLGSTFTMNIITIVVLGGTLSTGGKGNVFGTVLATIIIGLIKFGLPLCFGINSQYLDAPIGILLVVVLLGRALMVHPAFINYRAKLKNKRQKAA